VNAELEDHVTLFLDFLGFSEASSQLNVQTQSGLLQLLHSIAAMRSEFSVELLGKGENGSAMNLTPAISTFSDHIVVSFPIDKIEWGANRQMSLLLIISQIEAIIASVAQAALSLGFLIRGGVSLGKLYHSNGVVFGPAMIEAFELESRTAIYPRVVLSSSLSSALANHANHWISEDADGIMYIDYFRSMVWKSGNRGDTFHGDVKNWFDRIVPIIKDTIVSLSDPHQMNARSKWIWFARKFDKMLRNDAELFSYSKIDTNALQSIS
jgi:hypothetical protein